MRVLHLGKFFPPYTGGIERYVADLAAVQVADGNAVAVLAHAPPGIHRGGALKVDGVDVTLAACHGQLLYAPISPTFPLLLAQSLRRFQPELLHLHLPNTSVFWALLSPAARKLPWIVHWHSDIPLDAGGRRRLRAAYALYQPWERALLRRASAIVATSAPYLEASAALAPWRDKTRVVPLGIGPAPANSPARDDTPGLWPASGLRLLAVGRFSYYKGFDVLLRALAAVPAAQLLLIGTGECEAALRRRAGELRIEDRVRFAGHADDALLARAYAQADAFCLPSIDRAEAFGLVLLEAMRAGLPVIASDITGSGVGYVVRNGETGLLVPPRDADALAAAVRRLVDNALLRQRLGAAGRQRWQDEFTLDRSAQQVRAMYEKALASPRRAATASGT
jgi:glycosyltransferase involved in cell wall biosynthesis